MSWGLRLVPWSGSCCIQETWFSDVDVALSALSLCWVLSAQLWAALVLGRRGAVSLQSSRVMEGLVLKDTSR